MRIYLSFFLLVLVGLAVTVILVVKAGRFNEIYREVGVATPSGRQ